MEYESTHEQCKIQARSHGLTIKWTVKAHMDSDNSQTRKSQLNYIKVILIYS